MEKIASNKVASILSTVPGMLRTLATERDELVEKNAGLAKRVADYEHRDRVNQLAKVASEKHIDSLGETHEERVASIEDALGKGRNLDVMEEAVKLSSARGELGDLGDEIVSGNGSTQLETYLLGHLE